MTVAYRAFRLTSSPLRIKPLSVPTKRFLSSTPLAMNSGTAAYQTSFGAEGNLGIAPKQMSQLQSLKLNDGNEIPMVTSSQPVRSTSTDSCVAGLWPGHCSIQGGCQRTTRQRAHSNRDYGHPSWLLPYRRRTRYLPQSPSSRTVPAVNNLLQYTATKPKWATQ
jgi:hypothetical protein